MAPSMPPSEGLPWKHSLGSIHPSDVCGFVLFVYWLVLHIPLNGNIRQCSARAFGGKSPFIGRKFMEKFEWPVWNAPSANCTSSWRTIWNFGTLTLLAYLSLLCALHFGKWHALFRWVWNASYTQNNTFLISNDYIDNRRQGSKLFPFGYHYKFTSEQIKNEIIVLVGWAGKQRLIKNLLFPWWTVLSILLVAHNVCGLAWHINLCWFNDWETITILV